LGRRSHGRQHPVPILRCGGTWHEIEFDHVGYIEWIAADPRAPGVLYAASTTDKEATRSFGPRLTSTSHGMRRCLGGHKRRVDAGRTKFSPQVQMWCKWSFAADLEADQASGIAFYALKHTGTDELPVYSLYKWVPGD